MAFYTKINRQYLDDFFLLSILIAVITLIIKLDSKYKTRLLLLVILGASLQFGFAFLEGRGIDGIRDRVVKTGHAEFAKVAIQQDDSIFLLRNYESLLSSDRLGRFARSKPPGTLLFYVITKKLSEIGNREEGHKRKVENLNHLRDTISWLWPIISYFVLIPLFYFSRELYGDDVALLACALYLFVPSVNLITLHTDQIVYPYLALMPILLSAISARKNNILIALCAGIHLYLSIWFTFAIIYILPLLIVSCYFIVNDTANKRYLVFLKIISLVALGFLISDVAFRGLLNYDIMMRYQGAINHHIAWKQWTGTAQEIVYYGFLNLIEFIVWVGFPISILALMSFQSSVTDVYNTKTPTLKSVWPIAVIGVIVFLTFTGRTKGESARLWLFMVPFVCMLSAYHLQKYFNNNKMIIVALLILQFGTVYMTKVNQDF